MVRLLAKTKFYYTPMIEPICGAGETISKVCYLWFDQL